MRTPRPNFVVEYKTNRRQTKARPISIWGNLDLQAVARAVEADGAMPEGDLPQAPSVLEDVAGVEPAVVASDAQVDANGLPGNPTAMPSPNETIELALVDNNVFDDGSSPQEQPTSARARAPKSRAKPRARTQRSDVPERPAVLNHRLDPAVQDGSEEELAALEAENRHLKRLMVVKLCESNNRLKSMLLRFGGA